MDKRLQAIDSRSTIRVLESHGFNLKRSKGSHLQYTGFVKKRPRLVTVTAKQKRFAIDTLKSMIRQSGLSEAEWLDALGS